VRGAEFTRANSAPPRACLGCLWGAPAELAFDQHAAGGSNTEFFGVPFLKVGLARDRALDMNSAQSVRAPVWCLVIFLVAGLTLLAATTCPHVGWFGQIICGIMGAFLILAMVTGFTDLRHVEKLAHITQDFIRMAINGARSIVASSFSKLSWRTGSLRQAVRPPSRCGEAAEATTGTNACVLSRCGGGGGT
jgi:uncharacterized membrane protein YeaQ/YmgE (transglycosylase-associated protein family)